MLEGKVQLDVRLLSEGLFVALRKRSSFNGSLASDEHCVTSIGTTSLKIQPGEYDVLVRDEWFGWGAGNRGTLVVRETGLGTLTVQRDLSASMRPLVDVAFPGGARQFWRTATLPVAVPMERSTLPTDRSGKRWPFRSWPPR